METNPKPPRVQIGKQSYQLKLTIATADQVDACTGVDLIGDDANNVLIGLLFDQRKLGGVLWLLCKQQAEAHAVDQAAFNADLDSETLSAAWGAIGEAVAFFIPSHRREHFRMTLERQMAAIEEGTKAIARVIQSEETTQGIQRQMAEMEERAQGELARVLGESPSS